jgi:CO/xanthine dehydrogenase Mo-binding subunit
MGARGIGEHTMIPTPAAIANALWDACGIRISEMPITAEKVWRALKAKEKAEPARAKRVPAGATA